MAQNRDPRNSTLFGQSYDSHYTNMATPTSWDARGSSSSNSNNYSNINSNSNSEHKGLLTFSKGKGGQSQETPTTDGRFWACLAVTMACYNTAFMATLPLTAQYLSHRISIDWFNFTETNHTHEIPCTKEENTSDSRMRDEIQKSVSALSLVINYASSFPAILTCVPYGLLSDHIGRKKVILIPLIGGFVRMLVYLLVVKLNLSIYFLFLGSGVDGLCGSYHAMSMITAAAVADMTLSSGGRAISFAVIEAILVVSSAVSNLSVGYFIKYSGYFYPTVMMTGLALIALAVGIFLFPETNINRDKASTNPCVHLRKICSFYTSGGTKQRRVLFRLGLFMFFINILVSIGRSPIETLYTLNSPFCWDSVKIGIYGSIQSSVQIICSVLALKVLKPRMRLETIGIVAVTCQIGGFVLEGFAVHDWMIYTVPAIGMVIYTITPISRALMSKMAAASEQGALFASLSVVDAVCGILSYTAYNSVYLGTVTWYRGSVFFVMAVICAVNLVLFVTFRRVNTGDLYDEITTNIDAPSYKHSGRKVYVKEIQAI